LRLFDSLSREVRDLEIRPHMSVYVCGITPYDSAHLGHAFTYVHFDVLVRYLRYLGAEVVHVQNVTDLDDDILRVSRERGVPWKDLARTEVVRFEEQMRAIGVRPPTHSPWASHFVDGIEEDVVGLLAAGVAYERGRTVYFRWRAFPDYGRLSGLTPEEMLPLAEERGGHPEDPNKEDPLDFVLWQPSAADEPEWPSPLGSGRPGWHIECSAIVRRLAGQPVDIHGGGKDLIYPHHESEIALAESLPGEKPFARHWMHTGEVAQGGEKMSKSVGNMTFVDDLVERHGADAIRRFLLRRRYRADWEFHEDDIGRPAHATAGSSPEEFFEALDDDLDTPRALGVLEAAEPEGADWVEDGRAILGMHW
jgi:L-cysteine:1D-myo-inositol 2-amino-2-deoxy-alpha-D-glucopyranoside ligase